MHFFLVAYWHDPGFKNKRGGLIRIFELGDNLRRKGHTAVLFLPLFGQPRQQTRTPVVQIPIIDLPVLRPLFFHLLCSFFLILKGPAKVDWIYVRRMNSVLPLIVARLFKKKSVIEFPNDPFEAYGSKTVVRRMLEKWLDRTAMRMADRVVALSEWSADRLSRLGNVSREKIVVLPSGTDCRLFRPMDAAQCRRRLGLDDGHYYIGFVGTFLEHQGLDTLIEAAPRVLEQSDEVRFLLVGSGPAAKPLMRKVGAMGLSRFFIFTGYLPYREVPAAIGAMDLCLAPHRRQSNQASPVKIFDYLGCGKPVIASDIGVVREIAGVSGAVLRVPPEDPQSLADGILQLKADPQRCRQMSQFGRNHAVSKFDRKTLLEGFLHQLNTAAGFR